MRRFLVVAALVLAAVPLPAQNWVKNQGAKTNESSFRAIEEWPDPNDMRNAAGSPGSKYWQQQVDYRIARPDGQHRCQPNQRDPECSARVEVCSGVLHECP